MSSPQNLAIPPNQAVVAAGIEPDGTRSGIAIDSESRIIVSPEGGAPLPADAATHSAQTDGSQRTGVLGADGSTISSNANPIPISDAGGSITVDGTVAVSGTSAVSGTVTANQGTGGVSAWKVDGSAVTQPVSGTLAVSSVGGSVAVTNANLDAGLSTLATQTTLAALNAKVTEVDTGAVVVASSALPSGAATETTVAGVKSGTDRIPASPSQEHVTAVSPHATRLTDGAVFYKGAVAGDNLGADLRVSSAAVDNANPVPVSDAGGSVTVDGTVTSNIGTTGGVALDATLTGGTQIAIAKGPVTVGAAVGAEKPVLVGGTDGTNAQMINVDTTGAVRLQSGGTPGSAAPSRTTQVGGVNSAGILRTLLTDSQGRLSSVSADLFDRLRTAHTNIAVRGYQVEKASPVHFSSVTAVGGTVTYNSTDGTYDSATTGTSGSAAIDISNGIAHYRESFVIGGYISGAFSATGSTNKRVEWGLFGAPASSATSLQTADAFGFYLQDGVLGVFRRSSLLGAFPGNTVSTPQSSWNIDKLDGAGPSAYTFVLADLLNEFLYEPRFVWLGAKGIQYVLAGRLVHEVDFTAASSRISKPFARVPHMRVGVFMYNSGASSVLTFARNCSAAYVESEESPVEYPLTTSRPTPITTPAASGRVPLMALRIASTAKGRIALPQTMQVKITNQDSLIEIFIGKASAFTLTGASWTTPALSPDTLVEQDIASTAVTIKAGAALLVAHYVDSAVNSGISELDIASIFGESKRWLGIDGDAVQLNLVITATAQAGNNGTAAIREIALRELG